MANPFRRIGPKSVSNFIWYFCCFILLLCVSMGDKVMGLKENSKHFCFLFNGELRDINLTEKSSWSKIQLLMNLSSAISIYKETKNQQQLCAPTSEHFLYHSVQMVHTFCLAKTAYSAYGQHIPDVDAEPQLTTCIQGL